MDKQLYTYIIFILFTLYSCNASPLIGDKVKPAKKNEFPFIVSLGIFESCQLNKRYRNHFCGGSLITKRHVLTAAHCIVDKKPLEVIVTAGSIDLNKGKMYTIKSWITYDEWAIEKNIIPEFPSNDIAVITLSKNIDNIVPAVRSDLPDAEIFKKKVVTAGWGQMANYSKTRFLQKASLRVLTLEECKQNILKLFETESKTPPHHYCTNAQPPVVLSCGDSGSPLLLKDRLKIVGVNQASCGRDNDVIVPFATSIHVKVNYFKTFIDDASKD